MTKLAHLSYLHHLDITMIINKLKRLCQTNSEFDALKIENSKLRNESNALKIENSKLLNESNALKIDNYKLVKIKEVLIINY